MEEIRPEDVLFRRLASHQVRVTSKEANSSAYVTRDFPDAEISVYVERLMDRAMEQLLADLGKPDFGYGKLVAKDVTDLRFNIKHAPDEASYAHAIITGCSTLTHCGQLAGITQVVKMPVPRPKPLKVPPGTSKDQGASP